MTYKPLFTSVVLRKLATVQDFIFVAQEKKAPYASKIFKMSQEDMERGWLQLEHTLGEYSAVAMGKQQPTVYNSPSVVEVNLELK